MPRPVLYGLISFQLELILHWFVSWVGLGAKLGIVVSKRLVLGGWSKNMCNNTQLDIPLTLDLFND